MCFKRQKAIIECTTINQHYDEIAAKSMTITYRYYNIHHSGQNASPKVLLAGNTIPTTFPNEGFVVTVVETHHKLANRVAPEIH